MEGTRGPWAERGGLRAVASFPGALWGWWEIPGPWGPPALSSLWTQSELLPKSGDVETDSVRLDWTTSRWWTLESLTRKTEAWNLYVQPQSCFLGPGLSQLSKALDLAPPPPFHPAYPWDLHLTWRLLPNLRQEEFCSVSPPLFGVSIDPGDASLWNPSLKSLDSSTALQVKSCLLSDAQSHWSASFSIQFAYILNTIV